MDEYFHQLASYSKHEHLHPAGQILMTGLQQFENYLPSEMDDRMFDQIESSLLNLLNINKGNLSITCSTRIGQCLVKVYQTSNPPKIWNLVSSFNDNPNTAKIYAIGYVVDKIGKSVKSMIPGIAENLLRVGKNFMHPASYALAMCYKRDGTELAKCFKKSVDFAKRGLGVNLKKNEDGEQIKLMCLKLLRTIAKFDNSQNKKILSLAFEKIKEPESALIFDQACYTVAKILIQPILNIPVEEEEKDFSIAKKKSETNPIVIEFKNAFDTFRNENTSAFPTLLYHFLGMMKPNVICKYLTLLFKYIRSISQKEVYQLISLFGPDAKKELFDMVSKENPPSGSQLSLLMNLRYDFSSVQELAALALQISSSPQASSRKAAAEFFRNLSFKYPEHAHLYLETSTLYLATPPENNPTIERDLIGFAIIASSIIAGSSALNKINNTESKNISLFLENALSKNKLINLYSASAFKLMTNLPEYMIPKDLTINFLKEFSDKVVYIDNDKSPQKSIKVLSSSICSFLAKHPDEQYQTVTSKYFTKLINSSLISSNKIIINILEASTYMLNGTTQMLSIGKKIIPYLINASPRESFILKYIKYPMLRVSQLINTRSMKFEKISKKSKFAEKSLEIFGKFVSAFLPESISFFVKYILEANGNSLMCNSLLLSIFNNENNVKNIKSDVYEIIIKQFSKPNNELINEQILAECISKWVKLNLNYLNDVLIKSNNIKCNCKCLIYASLFSNIVFENNTLVDMMNEMNNIAIHFPENITYSLHALSSLFHSYSVRLSSLKVMNIQCQTIFSLFESRMPKPFELLYFSNVFIELLPILSPQIQNTDSSVLQILELIIQCFQSIDVPYSKQIMFKTMKYIFIFAKDLIKEQELEFPTSTGSTLFLQLSAAGAFSDMIKVGKTTKDYFHLLPNLLLLLQKTDDENSSDFIQSIAKSFVLNFKETERERLVEWITHIKTILSFNKLYGIGGLEIESGNSVKLCMLKVMNLIIPKLAESKPLLSESLDDIVTSLTRTAETKIEMLMEYTYKGFTSILDNFQNVISDCNGKLLNLYDPQFSISVRTGFQIDLSFSSEFLIKYFDFKSSDFNNLSSLYLTYIDCLSRYNQITPSYFELACFLVGVARKNPFLIKHIEEYGKTLVTQLCEVVSLSMVLSKDQSSINERSEYIKNFSHFYSNIITSFIWLQHLLNVKIIDNEKLMNFYFDEMKNSIEFWRISSAFEAIATLFTYYSDEIPKEKANEVIKIAETTKNTSNQFLKPYLSTLLQVCALILSSEKSANTDWDQLFSIVLSSKINSKTIANILYNGSENIILSNIDKIFNLISNSFADNSISRETCISIFNILFEKSEKVSIETLKLLTGVNSKQLTSLKFDLFRSGVKKCNILLENKDIFDLISLFVWINFKKGGMNVISSLLQQNPTNGVYIFTFRNFDELLNLCLKDSLNCPVYLQFALYGYTIYKNSSQPNKDIDTAASQLAIRTIIRWSSDIQKGTEITTLSVTLLNSVPCESTRAAFSALEATEQTRIVDLIKKQIAKMQTRARVRTLKTFSQNARHNDDDEWQLLD